MGACNSVASDTPLPPPAAAAAPAMPTSNSMASDAALPSPGPATIEQPEYNGTAANTVFNIPELRENILIHLPMKTLFTSQRVNKNWQYTIRKTKQIQKKMFLRAKEADGAFRTFERYEGDCVDENKHNIIYDFWSRQGAVEAVPLKDVLPGQKYALQASLNPLLCVTSVDEDPEFHDRAKCGELVMIQSRSVVGQIRRERGERRSRKQPPVDFRASYVDMFLCQPPVKAVKLRYAGHMHTIEKEKGVKIGDTVKACKETHIDKRWLDVVTMLRGVSPFKPNPGFFDMKFPGILSYKELGDPLLFCSPDDEMVEDPSQEIGVIYDTW